MHRSVILMAICAACCYTEAVAGPPDPVTNRLGAYDSGFQPRRTSRGSASPARYQESRRAPSAPGRRVAYEQAMPSQYQESVSPGPMVEGPMGGETWEEGAPWSDGGEYWEGPCDDCCASCGPCPGFWGRAEYLYWWLRGSNLPPLVTTSPNGTPQADAGVLPDATVLFGNERLNAAGRSGGRFTLGYWFRGWECTGIDATFLFLGDVNQQYYNSSNGSEILARPLFNVNTQAEDAQLLAYPGIVTGNIQIDNTSRAYGGDVNLTRVVSMDCWKRVTVMAGYRYFGLQESLHAATNTTSIDPQGVVPVGTTFAIFDRFSTGNNFNGGQLGIDFQATNCRWTFDFLAKFAIGAVSQRVAIEGGTTTTVPNFPPSSANGGILALQSNIGAYRRNQFSVLPEFAFDIRYQLTPLWRVNLGYTFMMLTNVVRPGDQIDLNVDPDLFPPAISGSQPKFVFRDADIWLQGINVGIECNF